VVHNSFFVFHTDRTGTLATAGPEGAEVVHALKQSPVNDNGVIKNTFSDQGLDRPLSWFRASVIDE